MHSLRLNYARNGERVSVIPEIRLNNGNNVPEFSVNCGYYPAIQSASNAVIGVLRAAVKSLPEGESCSRSALLRHRLAEELRPAAATLSSLLLPPPLTAVLQENPDISHVEIHADPTLNAIPWEGLIWENEYFGFRFAVSRWLLSNHRWPGMRSHAQRPRSRLAVIVDPAKVLPESISRSFDQLTREWMRCPGNHRLQLGPGGIYIRQDTMAVTFGGCLAQHDVVVVLTHHSHQGDAARPPGLQMSGPEAYTPAAMLGDLSQPGAACPKIFLSLSCESALTEAWEDEAAAPDRLRGFVDAALRSGVANYLGSIVDVPAAHASVFVRPFLDALVAGCSVAESTRRARLAFRENESFDPHNGGTLLGLAFALYGQGRLALWSAEGNAALGQVVRFCEQVESGQPCLRTVLENEDGWAQSRCAVHTTEQATSKARPADACGDPEQLHPKEYRPVAMGDPGYGRTPKLCNACFAAKFETLKRQIVVRR